jgi:hypothetical protein
MSGVILASFWRHLNGKPLRVEEQVAYYKRFWLVNAEPKKKSCPYDGSLLEVNMSFDESDNKQPRTIHIGRCKKRGHLWAYEHDKGWYLPDSDLRKRIAEP